MHFEKLVGFLRLPYPVGCAVFAIVLGSQGLFVASFLDTFNFEVSVTRTFFSSPFAIGELKSWQLVFSDGLFTVLSFYAFYVIRYMRLRLIRSEAEFLPLLPKGEEDFHRAFRGVSRSVPIVVMTVLVIVLSVPYTLGRIQTGPGFFWTSFNLVGVVVNSFGFATFLWVFFSSLRGLYNVGNQQLRLKSSYEDPLFGLRPLGGLSLTLSLLFFLGVGILVLAVFFFPDPLSVAGASAFSIVGLAFFFLPLYSIHRRMVEAKQREQRTIRLELARILSEDRNPSLDQGEATMSDLENRLSELKRVQALELAAREASSLRTWPFDTQILGRLTVIVLSTTAAIIARIIIVFAKL